ncbi:hypothetical protein P7C73_g4342, partial [Tremellales sp. Uapishka_1]
MEEIVPPFLQKIRTNDLARNAPGGSPQQASPSVFQPAALQTTAVPPPPNPLYLPPPAVPNVEEDLVPPENFALVSSGVYRCGFPKKRNFKFMEELKLKTVLTLVLEDYPEANLKWCSTQDVQFMQFGIPGNKVALGLKSNTHPPTGTFRQYS